VINPVYWPFIAAVSSKLKNGKFDVLI